MQNIINLDISKPIDVQTAAQALDGHIKLYFNLLSKFEVTSLHKNMAKMVICIEQENWQGVNMLAHMLKMSSGVIGGGKVHYASFYM